MKKSLLFVLFIITSFLLTWCALLTEKDELVKPSAEWNKTNNFVDKVDGSSDETLNDYIQIDSGNWSWNQGNTNLIPNNEWLIPPNEAIEACSWKTLWDVCNFIWGRWETLTWDCLVRKNQNVCVPEEKQKMDRISLPVKTTDSNKPPKMPWWKEFINPLKPNDDK